MSPKWWFHESERTLEDERAVADLRMKMERIMRQLEATIEEMRNALEEEGGPEDRHHLGPEGGSLGGGGGDGFGGGPEFGGPEFYGDRPGYADGSGHT